MNSLVGGSDYQEIIALNLDVLLTFNDANRQRSFHVTIIKDSLFEVDVENFILELRFDPFALELPSNVILHPDVSAIEILDDDGKLYNLYCVLLYDDGQCMTSSPLAQKITIRHLINHDYKVQNLIA